MKTVIFSDTHLGPIFEQAKFNFLAKLIDSADRVIINGDFWEGCLIDFNQFCQSPWNKLFPLLKSKQTIYLYGNHDPKELSDEKVNSFADVDQHKIDINIGSHKFHLEHGHEIVPGSESLNFLPNKQTLCSIGTRFMDRFEGLGVALFGSGFSKIFLNRHIETVLARRRLLANSIDTTINILGHFHLPQHDPDSLFCNSGCIKYGYASYLVIEKDEIELVQTQYKN